MLWRAPGRVFVVLSRLSAHCWCSSLPILDFFKGHPAIHALRVTPMVFPEKVGMGLLS